MLLVGMEVSGLVFGVLLDQFSQIKLIQVIQGAAGVTVVLNVIALWKQEVRQPHKTAAAIARPDFKTSWQTFSKQPNTLRFLIALGLGTAAFSMQDIILEPYGGEILGLSVGATTMLTALMAAGALTAFALSARLLSRGMNAYRLAAYGLVAGLFAFSAVIFSEPLGSATLFRVGATLIGFGGGLFSVGTLTAAMGLESHDTAHGFGSSGLVLGAWGAVHATATGVSIALGGAIRDGVSSLATQGLIGSALNSNAIGYSFVYHLELYMLFATLIAIGPLVRASRDTAKESSSTSASKFGLAEFPG
jgi:BCD family chlorophyll transporter-like MFS transporter